MGISAKILECYTKREIFDELQTTLKREEEPEEHAISEKSAKLSGLV